MAGAAGRRGRGRVGRDGRRAGRDGGAAHTGDAPPTMRGWAVDAAGDAPRRRGYAPRGYAAQDAGTRRGGAPRRTRVRAAGAHRLGRGYARPGRAAASLVRVGRPDATRRTPRTPGSASPGTGGYGRAASSPSEWAVHRRGRGSTAGRTTRRRGRHSRPRTRVRAPSGALGEAVRRPERPVCDSRAPAALQPPLCRRSPRAVSARPAAAWAGADARAPGPSSQRIQAARRLSSAVGRRPALSVHRTPGSARASVPRWPASSPGASPAGRVIPARVSTVGSTRSPARAPEPAP